MIHNGNARQTVLKIVNDLVRRRCSPIASKALPRAPKHLKLHVRVESAQTLMSTLENVKMLMQDKCRLLSALRNYLVLARRSTEKGRRSFPDKTCHAKTRRWPSHFSNGTEGLRSSYLHLRLALGRYKMKAFLTPSLPAYIEQKS